MSGTSADGVDVALVEITGRGLEMSAKLLHHHARAYDGALRRRIFAARESGSVSLAELGELGREISIAYAMAVNGALGEANIAAGDVAAIAAHGQTLFHGPPNTIQWIDPALVAAEVGCAVVSDFRRADCAAGGQGAPLVPFADYVLFRHATKNRLVVNIGGIANATVLKADGRLEDVIAYDTGPGNCISDFLMREADPDGPGYDERGRIANRGTPMRELQTAFRKDAYFVLHLNPFKPKTTDVPRMIALFQRARAQFGQNASLPDLLATACDLCAIEISSATRYFGMQPECELILSGGGTRNRAIMFALEYMFAQQPIATTDDFGVPSAAKEALAFALLGAATLDGIPSNVPSATGARRGVVLGSVTPRP
jgi:anhydro-N-acetylmuramic acid kinase